MFKCKSCDSTFQHNKSLLRHTRQKHNDVESLYPYECEDCNRKFMTKNKLIAHLENHGFNFEFDASRKNSKILCAVVGCQEKLSNYKYYYLHLSEKHEIRIEEKDLLFNRRTEFDEWMESLTKENMYYVKESSTKSLKGGKRCDYYRCHRSYSSNITSGQRTKYCESRKIGSCCPSQIRVVEEKKRITVHFVKSHLGHELDVGTIPLTTSQKGNLASKLKDGVPFERILSDIQLSSFDCSTTQRIHLTDRQDLFNICREFDIDRAVVKHKNDYVSVKIWVEEMKTLGENNPVLYFKNQNEKDPESTFSEDDFILVMMTTFQRKILLQFGQNVVCTDGTHGLNSYDFYLYSLVVIDEFGNGVPAAFCLSNLKSMLVYQKYFSVIKSTVGAICPKVFMSDSETDFYTAWMLIMGEVEKKILCLWHVFKNWVENMSKVSDPKKRELVLKTLKALCYELDSQKFEIGMKNFLTELKDDSDTNQFYFYFEKEWYNKRYEWTMCYRKYIGVSTNMVLESLHQRIKYHYLLGLKCRRLDKSLNALLRLSNDDKYRRMIKIKRKKPSDRIKRISKSHEDSAIIPSEYISCIIDDSLWLVKSMSQQDVEYEVKKIRNECEELCCALKCKTCRICIHLFQCDCKDNVVRYNICKHIHSICQKFSSDVCEDNVNPVTPEVNVPIINPSIPYYDEEDDLLPSNPEYTQTSCLSQIQTKIERINTLLPEMPIAVSYEKSVKLNRLLDRVINEMMVLVNSPKNSSSSTNFKSNGEKYDDGVNSRKQN